MSEITRRDESEHGIDAQCAILLTLGWLAALWLTLS